MVPLGDQFQANGGLVGEQWQRVSVPRICERLLGFSVPQDDQVLVISSDGTHLIRLGEAITVTTDSTRAGYDVYRSALGICRYQDREWQIIGLHGQNHALLTTARSEWLELDEADKTISVLLGGVEDWSSSYENFSGDWAAARFSADGRFIVLGCPFDFDFRVWRRVDPARD
jgi:hypothetical protein